MYNPEYRDKVLGFWRHRGYLPHLEDPRALQHVTFHLADSIPGETLDRIRAEVESLPADQQLRAKRERLDKWLDAGHGACALNEPAIACQMQDTIRFFDGDRYELFAWCVMPNHVHVLLQALRGHAIGQIVKSWKSYSGRFISSAMGKNGGSSDRIWQREHWDRYIRSARHFERVEDYIHQNPVKAGLVGKASDWPWSSANPDLLDK